MNENIIESFLSDKNLKPIYLENGFDFHQHDSEIKKIISKRHKDKINKYIFQNAEKKFLYLICNKNFYILFNCFYLEFFDSYYNSLGNFRNFLDIKADPQNRYINTSHQQCSYNKSIIYTIPIYKKNIISTCLEDNLLNINNYKIGLLSLIYTKQNTIIATTSLQYINSFSFDLSGKVISVTPNKDICSLWNIPQKEIFIENYQSLILKTKEQKEVYKLLTDESITLIKKNVFLKIIESVKNINDIRNFYLSKNLKMHYDFIFNNLNHKNFKIPQDFEIIINKLNKNFEEFIAISNKNKKNNNSNARKILLNHKNIDLLNGIYILEHFESFLFSDNFISALKNINVKHD